MTVTWEVLGTRARGLGTHLLSEGRIATVMRVSSGSDFIRELGETPYAPFLPPRGGAVRQLEVGITRSLADRMSTLARWAGPDAASLAPLLLEQDARNVRVALRGAVGELTPDQRIAGSIPTPTLGRRALEALARAESPGALAATLVAWRHPLGSVLLSEARRTHPDLFRLEVALTRCLALKTSVGARRAGEAMRDFVSETIDTQNLTTALLLAGARSESATEDLFVAGGRSLGRRHFVGAASSADRLACVEALARATRGTVFERPLRESPTTPAGVSKRILEARIGRLARDSRAEPVSAFPVLLFILRLRREASLVRRALWGAHLARGALR